MNSKVNSKMNPIESISEWVDGVGHHHNTKLYTALSVEEVKEMLESIGHHSEAVRTEVRRAIGVLDGVSYTLRHTDNVLADRLELLDAALDTAWVSLCLAYTLTGDKLPEAWAELHRSNVTDKQVNGEFKKDASGKVIKPDTWRAPNFMPFLRRG